MGIKVTFNKKTIVHEYNTVTNTALTDTPKDNNLIDAQHSKGSQPDTPKDHNSELMSFLIELTGVSKKNLLCRKPTPDDIHRTIRLIQ